MFMTYDMFLVFCAVVGIALVLVQLALFGFDVDSLFFENEEVSDEI